MQTFLPTTDFEECARVLDWRRLGKQRVEAQQILNALRRGGGWKNHPAVRMWRGYIPALTAYRNAMITEWKRRGYNNTMRRTRARAPVVMPPWLGDDALHASHRSNLLRKLPDHYGKLGWTEPPTLPYVWPV